MRGPGLKLFFDGGCRPNPGPIEIAVVARGVAHVRTDLGSGTNNDAEWLALIESLRVAEKLGETDVELRGDSLLVINQAKRLWRCRSAELRGHLVAYAGLAAGFDRIRLRHVGRSQNLAGIALERLHGRL